MEFLVETALLTHGLRSVTQKELLSSWPFAQPDLVWVDGGRIVRGAMRDYLPFRAERARLRRIDCDTLDAALRDGVSGALTASGTMAVCQKLNIPLAVTCGMGGIGDVKGEELCPDLPALARIPTALISTSPKDMLDIPATLAWLASHGVHVAGAPCTGYVFCGAGVPTELPLSACTTEAEVRRLAADGGLLMLHPIPETRRIADRRILDAAIRTGKAAERSGGYFHPAVNGELDRLTGGESSRMQLESLIANIRLAQSL